MQTTSSKYRIEYLNAELIANTCSPRHVQSVIEDLVSIVVKHNQLSELVLRLNPKCNEIGTEVLANLQVLAKETLDLTSK